MKILIGLLGAAACFALYVRLAPSDVARWHRGVADISPNPEGSFRTSLEGADFARLHEQILQTPRTRVLAGDVAAGHVTYVTRSALWGFPDYTTVEQTGSEITLVGRLRFGRSDLGVNKKRIQAWGAALT
jgi:uncharacterized protein (DUF1499 family)